MKKNKFIILFLLTCLNFQSIGQIQVGLKLGNGISKIKLPNSFVIDRYKKLFTYSGQVGVYSVIPINKNIFFQNEILFNQLEGRFTSGINSTDGTGQFIGEGKILLQTHQSYLSIPLKFGFQNKKINFIIGLQTSFEFYNQSRERLVEGGAPIPLDLKREMNTPKYDIGPLVEFRYNFLNSFSIGIQGYYGLKKLSEEEGKISLGKQQFLLNVYNRFYKGKAKDSE